MAALFVRLLHMRAKDLPERWRTRLEEWIRRKSSDHRLTPGAPDFPSDTIVHIELADGSSSHFRFAFAIEAPDIGELGIFTEHCGYHIFPLADAKIRISEKR